MLRCPWQRCKLSVPSWKPSLPLDLRLLVEEHISNITIHFQVFAFWWFFWGGFFRFFGSLRTMLLCIVGELAGGGIITVAVGVSDRWQVTRHTWHLTSDTWHLFIWFFDQRWKNVQACKQRLCKFFPSLGKICAKFYAVLSRKWVMLRFCASWGNTNCF